MNAEARRGAEGPGGPAVVGFCPTLLPSWLLLRFLSRSFLPLCFLRPEVQIPATSANSFQLRRLWSDRVDELTLMWQRNEEEPQNPAGKMDGPHPSVWMTAQGPSTSTGLGWRRPSAASFPSPQQRCCFCLLLSPGGTSQASDGAGVQGGPRGAGGLGRRPDQDLKVQIS